jgi:hypothetical protein
MSKWGFPNFIIIGHVEVKKCALICSKTIVWLDG